MEHLCWATIDKTGWGDGPWQLEPDKEQWLDEDTSLPCLLVRSGFSGSLCGYVGVPEGHPWHGRPHEEIAASYNIGVNYAALCQAGPQEISICHVPGTGDPDSVWWVGFHTAHWWNITPALEARDRARGWEPVRSGEETYKTAGWVRDQCALLAKAAMAAAG